MSLDACRLNKYNNIYIYIYIFEFDLTSIVSSFHTKLEDNQEEEEDDILN